jgi:hypothetical protein
MKKVTAIIASQQKRATYGVARTFEAQLRALGEVEFEYVFLKDYRLENCRGCCQCFEKGEEHCPIKDDRDLLIQKISRSDGVVLATPNYAFQVAGAMKTPPGSHGLYAAPAALFRQSLYLRRHRRHSRGQGHRAISGQLHRQKLGLYDIEGLRPARAGRTGRGPSGDE